LKDQGVKEFDLFGITVRVVEGLESAMILYNPPPIRSLHFEGNCLVASIYKHELEKAAQGAVVLRNIGADPECPTQE